jgi:hypothetical protein
MYVSMLRVWWYGMRRAYEMEKRSDEKMINQHQLKARIYTIHSHSKARSSRRSIPFIP